MGEPTDERPLSVFLGGYTCESDGEDLSFPVR